MTAVQHFNRFPTGNRKCVFLTYDEQSKAIAQLSQVRHKVHQNQELRGTAAERESVYHPSMICADIKQNPSAVLRVV